MSIKLILRLVVKVGKVEDTIWHRQRQSYSDNWAYGNLRVDDNGNGEDAEMIRQENSATNVESKSNSHRWQLQRSSGFEGLGGMARVWDVKSLPKLKSYCNIFILEMCLVVRHLFSVKAGPECQFTV
eukprot:Gb_28931 [translate_table: standard]